MRPRYTAILSLEQALGQDVKSHRWHCHNVEDQVESSVNFQDQHQHQHNKNSNKIGNKSSINS